MTDLERLLEAEAKLKRTQWTNSYDLEVQDALFVIRNHLRPVLLRAQRIEEAARKYHGCPKYRRLQSLGGPEWFDKDYPCEVCAALEGDQP